MLSKKVPVEPLVDSLGHLSPLDVDRLHLVNRAFNSVLTCYNRLLPKYTIRIRDKWLLPQRSLFMRFLSTIIQKRPEEGGYGQICEIIVGCGNSKSPSQQVEQRFSTSVAIAASTYVLRQVLESARLGCIAEISFQDRANRRFLKALRAVQVRHEVPIQRVKLDGYNLPGTLEQTHALPSGRNNELIFLLERVLQPRCMEIMRMESWFYQRYAFEIRCLVSHLPPAKNEQEAAEFLRKIHCAIQSQFTFSRCLAFDLTELEIQKGSSLLDQFDRLFFHKLADSLKDYGGFFYVYTGEVLLIYKDKFDEREWHEMVSKWYLGLHSAHYQVNESLRYIAHWHRPASDYCCDEWQLNGHKWRVWKVDVGRRGMYLRIMMKLGGKKYGNTMMHIQAFGNKEIDNWSQLSTYQLKY